jgi:energy-coupling factor transport system permease protein
MRLQNITLGQFAERDSFIHRLDPRTKIAALMIWSIVLFAIDRMPLIVLFGVLMMTLYPLSKLSIRLAWGNIRPFIWLFLLTVGLHAFMTEGPKSSIPLIGLGVSIPGLAAGAFYALRIIVLIVLANAFTLTTSPLSLTDAMEHLLSPFKRIGVRSHEIALMTSISLRFIPIFLEEIDRIRMAQTARGASFDGGLIKKIKSVVPIVVPLFVSVFRRANDLAVAMESRCYRGGEGRTHFVVLRYQVTDGFAFVAVCAIGAVMVSFRWIL